MLTPNLHIVLMQYFLGTVVITLNVRLACGDSGATETRSHGGLHHENVGMPEAETDVEDKQTRGDDAEACKVQLLQRSMTFAPSLALTPVHSIAGHRKHSDVHLELPDVLAETCSEGFGAHGATSPSFLLLPNSSDVWSVFRGLCFANKTKFLPCRWTSFLILGSSPKADIHGLKAAINWNAYSRVQDPRFMHDTHLQECRTTSNPDTGVWNEGPEDPKLFTNNGKHYLMFVAPPLSPEGPISLARSQTNETEAAVSSLDVLVNPEAAISHASSDAEAFLSRPHCKYSRMLPHIVQLQFTSLPTQIRFGPVLPLTFQGMHPVEKNWLPFNWKPSNDSVEHSLMVYDMQPHTIMKVNMSTGHLVQVHAEYSPLLAAFVRDMGAQRSVDSLRISGNGAGVVPTTCADGSPCHLAVFHMHKDILTKPPYFYDRSYMHWPYLFSAEPPFEIKAIGKRALPLDCLPNPVLPGWCVQFVTSIVEDAGHIIIGYNTGDQESNIFRMSRSEFQSEFFE